MSSEFSNLDKAILRSVAFFDIFDYPLTLVEIHKWLYQPDQTYSLLDIRQALDNADLKTEISHQDGFYFFQNRQDIINIRLSRYSLAEKKYQVALRVAKALRYLAGVEMMAVCNSVGYNNGSKNSDIDFFIIAKQGRVWWTRLLVIALTTFLRLRHHGKKVKDRACLSFYVADSRLSLKDIALPDGDPYLVYWFATLAPIYNQAMYDKLMTANNWLTDYLPNLSATSLNHRRYVMNNKLVSLARQLGGFILRGKFVDYIESLAQKLQRPKMDKYFGELAVSPNTNVILSDNMLKLHKTDRRSFYKDAWHSKTQKLGL